MRRILVATTACVLAWVYSMTGRDSHAGMPGVPPGPAATLIRHPDRVSALLLLVPLAHKPGTLADSAPASSPLVEKMLMRLIGSDFLFWSAPHVARSQVISVVLATPPELLAAARPQEPARRAYAAARQWARTCSCYPSGTPLAGAEPRERQHRQ